MQVQISTALRRALSTTPIRHYQLAALANLHPSTLSKLLHGGTKIREHDRRVLAIAKVVGVDPAEALEEQDRGEEIHVP